MTLATIMQILGFLVVVVGLWFVTPFLVLVLTGGLIAYVGAQLEKKKGSQAT